MKSARAVNLTAGFLCVVVFVLATVALLFAAGPPRNLIEQVCALGVILLLAAMPFGWLKRKLGE